MAKVRCTMVISPNGFISKLDGNEDWIDEVNWTDFLADVKKHNNCILGRATYDLVPELDEAEAQYKLVVTSDSIFNVRPGYKVVNSPQEAIDFLKDKDIEEILLIGGGGVNTSFLKAGLVNEVELFIAPHIIGQGKPVFKYDDFEIDLQLIKVEQLSKDRVKVLYRVKNRVKL